jgi:capsular polysaccharide transport system permease protein
VKGKRLTEKQQKPAGADDETRAVDAPQDDIPPPGRENGRRRQGKKAQQSGLTEQQVIEIRPMAQKASMRKRHWGLTAGFLLIVVIPLAMLAYYLREHATDQFASVAGFSVRQEDNANPTEILGGLASFVGGSGDAEADMLYQYMQSQDLVASVDARMDLRKHYTQPYDSDPIFALKPGGTIEDLLDYWHRIVRVAYDPNTRLITLNVLAFEPEMAQRLAQEIIAESQTLVNELNATARADALKYAEQDLEDAVARLKAAREALVHFRTSTQIVDPESDLQGRMGVLNSLQQQLAQALIEHDLIIEGSSPDDPRVGQARRRIEVIRERISEERATFAAEDSEAGVEGYPTLLAEYESLAVDREFAEQTYRVALANLDLARANAARQSRYLATFVRPTLPQKAEYPQRLTMFGIAALFLVLLWAILSLMFYAVRDRK